METMLELLPLHHASPTPSPDTSLAALDAALADLWRQLPALVEEAGAAVASARAARNAVYVLGSGVSLLAQAAGTAWLLDRVDWQPDLLTDLPALFSGITFADLQRLAADRRAGRQLGGALGVLGINSGGLADTATFLTLVEEAEAGCGARELEGVMATFPRLAEPSTILEGAGGWVRGFFLRNLSSQNFDKSIT